MRKNQKHASKQHSNKRQNSSSTGSKDRWSAEVTETSDALDLENHVFARQPAEIAQSLKRSAERSRKRKSSPFQSAMSMLTFYINRAGTKLGAKRRRALDRAKNELRKAFGRPAK